MQGGAGVVPVLPYYLLDVLGIFIGLDYFTPYLKITFYWECNMNQGTNQANIKQGLSVGIVLKQDQRSGKIPPCIVKKILTKSAHKPHEIKVQLENGQVRRVKEIHSE